MDRRVDNRKPSLNGLNLKFSRNGFGVPTSSTYKSIPIFPITSPAVDHLHSNRRYLRSSCLTCFPETVPVKHDDYVDLLQFSNFGGLPYPMAPGLKPPSRWFADLRYAISTPLNYRYPAVKEEVMKSERVKRSLSLEVASSGLTPKSVLDRALRIFNEIHATLSWAVCKACGYVLFKVFRRLMTRLLVSPAQMKQLQIANATGIPIVYLPLHQSHLDYLLITWAAWHFDLPLPHIASGDNLNLSGFGWLLRSTGAFFIRRRLDPNVDAGKDMLYRAVLHSYIEQVLKKGMPIEFFLEGTRSRFGKSLIPKHGLISNVVEAVQQGIITDCYLVPVSYTYDRVAEGVFLNELMGVPKVRESFLGVLRGVIKGFGVSQRCGAVRMHFGQPVLLTDYLAALSHGSKEARICDTLTRLPHSYSYRELVPWHREHIQEVDNRTLIRSIGYHIVYEAQASVSISLGSVVSTLLLCKFRQGVPHNILSADVQWLCEEILRNGSEVMGWRDSDTSGSTALEYGITYIRESIKRECDFIEPSHAHRHLIHLAYSKNALIPLFAIKGVLALIVTSLPPNELTIDRIVHDAHQLCDWMQNEFIACRPCENISDVISDVLHSMSEGVTSLLIYDDEEESTAGSVLIRNDEQRSVLYFYANMMRPIVQSLFLVCQEVAKMGAETKESEPSFIRSLCKNTLRDINESPFPLLVESINSDSFKNGIRLLREKKMVYGKDPYFQVLQVDEIQSIALRLKDLLKVYI